MTGTGRGKKETFLPSPSPFHLFFAPALTFAQWLDRKRLLRRLVFARSHAHENTKTVEIRYHPLQGMGYIIYEIIIFVLSHKNNQPAFSKNSTPRTVFENQSFCCRKTPFTCGRRAKTEDKNRRFQECSDTWGLGLELIFCFLRLSFQCDCKTHASLFIFLLFIIVLLFFRNFNFFLY